jgi:D-glycero-beta-D-manno-heptose 1-phosphate adenylyltransferase
MNTTFWSERFKDKLLLPADIALKRESLRKNKLKVVTLNGTFDLLHTGHLHILYEAKKQGDILIVAINSDSSIKILKGEKRPINPLLNRLEFIAAFSFVDYVTWFEETTPLNILEKLHPDVHVNGIEYGENCIEAPFLRSIHAKLHLVDRLENLSSTRILEQCAF